MRVGKTEIHIEERTVCAPGRATSSAHAPRGASRRRGMRRVGDPLAALILHLQSDKYLVPEFCLVPETQDLLRPIPQVQISTLRSS